MPTERRSSELLARPIVKWAGGKSRLLPRLLPLVPDHVRTYAEPFAGGAALFFALAAGGKRFERAVLCDQNAELVSLYRGVRDDVDAVLAALAAYRYDRDLYYHTRAQCTDGWSDARRAARVLFLNKTCFNGLWRVNAAGEFNVPFGRYTNPRIVDEPRLRAASACLAGVEILQGDFSVVCKELGDGDFAYFDPPYVPVSRTATFTSYAATGFRLEDQERLAEELRQLAHRGVRAVLSNADTRVTRTLYRGLRCRRVQVSRAINSDPTKRGVTGELIVTNWGPTPRGS